MFNVSFISFFLDAFNDNLHLLGYVAKHRDPSLDDFPDVGKWPIHVQISHYAGICGKRLDRIGDTGRLGPKKPTVDEIDQSRLQIFRPSMFGGTLQETLDMQRDRFPHKRLPWILTILTEQILKLNGAKTEGIFRVPADHDEVNNVKRYKRAGKNSFILIFNPIKFAEIICLSALRYEIPLHFQSI